MKKTNRCLSSLGLYQNRKIQKKMFVQLLKEPVVLKAIALYETENGMCQEIAADYLMDRLSVFAASFEIRDWQVFSLKIGMPAPPTDTWKKILVFYQLDWDGRGKRYFLERDEEKIVEYIFQRKENFDELLEALVPGNKKEFQLRALFEAEQKWPLIKNEITEKVNKDFSAYIEGNLKRILKNQLVDCLVCDLKEKASVPFERKE